MRDTRLRRLDDGAGGAGGSDSGDATANSDMQLSAVLARYREMVAAQPDLVPGMVQGMTVEEIDASAAEARRAYGEISRRVVQRYEREVPAGNPARSSSDVGVENLKPEAKIALGLRRTER